MTMQPQEHRLLYRVALAYYDAGLTQQEIARRFGLSRPKVSRLLAQARDERVVVINLVPPSQHRTALERDLEVRFGLDEALVIPSPTFSDLGRPDQDAIGVALGSTAADCLMRSIAGARVLAMAWGSSIQAVVDALPVRRLEELTVVQLNGGLGPVGEVEHSTQLAQRMARKLGARLSLLPAPGIVSTVTAAHALLSEQQVQQTLRQAAEADVALVGLGVPHKDSVLVRDGSLVTAKDIFELESLGSVGDIALRYVTEAGEPVRGDLAQRTIGLSLDELRSIPRVIGVAGGVLKANVIRAALRGKLLNVLVTDEQTARMVLGDE